MAKNVVTLNLDNTDYSFRPYGTCSTSAHTAAKTVSITGFTLCTGATILVKFSNSNTIVDPTLNVNGTGDKPIIHLGHRFDSNIYYEFIYNGSDWVQIGEEKHRCSVASGNKNNYPWHRIAYTDVLTTPYIRRTISLILNQAAFGGRYGELVIKVNTNSANTNSSYEVYWVVNKGFGADDIRIGVNNTYGNTYFDVFYKCPGTWQNLLIEQKTGGYDSSFTKSFTLCSSQEVSDTTTTDKLTSYECYATIESAATELHNTAYTAIISPNTSSGTLGKISFNGNLTGNATTSTTSSDSNKLGGQLPAYYATADALDTYKTTVSNTYVKKAGDTMTGDLTIKTNSSGAPSVIFQRGETNDTFEDWKLTAVGGYFKIQNRNSENTWIDVLSLAPSTIKTLTSSYSVSPTTTNALDLGSSSMKWRNVYGNYFSGTSENANNIGDLKYFKYMLPDNGGRNSYILIAKMSNWVVGTSSNYYLIGTIYGQRGGNQARTHVFDITAQAVSYTTTRQSILNVSNHYSSGRVVPCIVEYTDENNETCNYLALKKTGSGDNIYFVGLMGSLLPQSDWIELNVESGQELPANMTVVKDTQYTNTYPITTNSYYDGSTVRTLLHSGNYSQYANKYELPAATSSALGGIKIGYTQSGKNYPVQLDANNKAYVNVPWTDTDTNTDTKNTAGATNSASKMYLIGATSQDANPQTYSNSNVYATNGDLVANSFQGSIKGTSADNVNTAYKDLHFRFYNNVTGCDSTVSTDGKRYAGTANSYGFPVSNNANAMLWLGAHSGNYGHQLGFSSDGRIYDRYISNGSFPTTVNGGSWKKMAFTSDIPTKTSDLTNDSGYLTSIETATTAEITALFN